MTRNNKKKPRSTTLYMDMGKPVALNRIGFRKDGSIIFEDNTGEIKPSAAFIQNCYNRQNKHPKIINLSQASPDKLTNDSNIALANYTWVIAIDTNKPEITIPHIVFTGIAQAKINLLPNNKLEVIIYQGRVLEFHNLTSSSERFGWAYVIKSINSILKNIDRIAVIVDSELKSIPLINQRKEPILDEYYLPSNFELIYASSDTGMEFLANQLLKDCDKYSREVAKLVASNKESNLPILIESNPEESFTHFRSWEQCKNC